MIEYWKGPYSLNLIFQIHGSTLYGSFLPGIISCIIYYIFNKNTKQESSEPTLSLVSATVISTLVTSVSFVIVYRVKFCYNRYWQASQDVHIMTSKWMDATVHASCFHMQSPQFKAMQPPSIFKHPSSFDPNVYTDRQILKQHNSNGYDNDNTNGSWIIGKGDVLDGGWGLLFSNKSDNCDEDDDASDNTNNHNNNKADRPYILYSDIARKDEGSKPSDYSWAHGKTPSVFLQELAHLSSLCVAVAFDTFRDIDGDHTITSPFGTYEFHKPWPATNPYNLDRQDQTREGNHHVTSFFGCLNSKVLFRYIRFFFGLSRSPDARTEYSTGRPLLVLGGVSDNEIAALRRARGASAKMTLAWFWLSEFITREHLAGSLGKVQPPIVSRIHQFLSDGMKFYNDARMIVYIPFPFVHDQLSTVIVAPLLVFIPLMVSEYTKTFWVGLTLSFLIITCINGFLEVARELENPFRNFPNDIPLCTLLAMYNESLMTMCSGFHPDQYWRRNNPNKLSAVRSDSRMDEIDDIIASI